MAGAALVGGLFAILLFTVLPTVLVGGLGKVVILTRWPRVILEAVLKLPSSSATWWPSPK